MQNRHSRIKKSDNAEIRLLLLGPMEIYAGDRQIVLSARKARALLAYLALRSDEAVPRETLCGLFWGEREEEQARASLRQTLSAIRKALGQDAAGSLLATNESVTLLGRNIQVDIAQMDIDASQAGADDLGVLAEYHRGELLEGLTLNEHGFDQWLSAERERARSLVIGLLSKLLDVLERDRRIEEAITYGARLIAIDPLQEHIHRKLMGLYMAQGRHDAALSQFEQCRRELAQQLDVAPEQATLDVANEIKNRRREPDGNKDHGNISGSTSLPPDGSQNLNPAPGIQPPPLPDKPSIAVLAFTNMSNDPEQEYFSDGITEDIITELSRFGELFVIARNSSFVFKGKATDIREVGQKLGVQYVLEGSVRKAGNSIRVTAQLVNTTTSDHIWAERYDRELVDIFEIQDELTRSIVSTIKGRVDVDFAKYTMRKPTTNLSAYECVLQGQALVHRYKEEDFEQAHELFKKAVSLDPDFARAYGWLSYVNGTQRLYWQASNEGIAGAIEIAQKGLDLDANDSRCHLALGLSFLFSRQHDKAEHHFQKALSLNPNDDLIIIEFARFKMYTGQPLEGAQFVRRAMRQNPYHPNWYWNILARCLHTAKDYLGAISALEQIETVPFWSHAYLAACHAELGHDREAKEHAAQVLEQKPDFAVKKFQEIFPYRDADVLNEFFSSFKKAGLP